MNMAKWHLNTATGDYNKCNAKPGNCPLGGDQGDENHFNTKKEAAQAAEKFLDNKFGKFSTDPRIVKQQQTKQLKTLFKIQNQLDDAGYRIMNDYSNLVVRSMVEGKPQQAKRFMDEIVQDLSEKSKEYSTALNFDWKMGVENLPEQLETDDKKDVISQRLRLLYKASDYFDDAGVDLANDHSTTIMILDGPFSEENKEEVSTAISDFATDLSMRGSDANWLDDKHRVEFENLMGEYYSINKW